MGVDQAGAWDLKRLIARGIKVTKSLLLLEEQALWDLL